MKNYFCGWYFKCQSNNSTFAVIPACVQENGRQACFIQLITDDGVYSVPYPYSSFSKKKKGLGIRIGENYFSENGIRLNLHTDQLNANGVIRFGSFTPIRYDIMGPFCYVPFLECRHSVFSMQHSVHGRIQINGVWHNFKSGTGYIEGDRGCSFPSEYAWTQCSFSEGSLMLSIANIPFAGFHFTGIIGVIFWRGMEYRLATYLGAKVIRLHHGEIIIRQGNLTFTAKLLKANALPLYAPVHGMMSRTIHESPSCLAFYCFEREGKPLFSFVSEQAAFEYEYSK